MEETFACAILRGMEIYFGRDHFKNLLMLCFILLSLASST